MRSIVITGGPCSGKTSALEPLAQALAQASVPAVFVAEAGTDLIMRGVSPESCGSMLPFQIQVAQLQIEREAQGKSRALALEEDGVGNAAACEALVICDRGIADGAAYLPQSEYALMLDAVGLSAQEALLRYDAVFCLESAAKIDSTSYTLANNAARSETAEEAAALDDRTYAAWQDHPRFHFIGNEADFADKAAKLSAAILSFAHPR